MAVWHHSLSALALAGSEWSTTHNSCLNPGKEPLSPLGEPQSWCGCFGERKKLLLLLNQTSDCPAHSVVIIQLYCLAPPEYLGYCNAIH
jgi:hypothetical protein